MTITLSTDDLYQIWNDSLGSGTILQYSDELTTFTEFPQQLGKGYWRDIQLRSGINLLIQDYSYHDSIIEYGQAEESPHFVSSFYLAGNYQSIVPGMTDCRYLSIKSNQMFLMADTKEIDKTPGQEQIISIKLQIEPHFLQSFNHQPASQLPLPLQRWIDQKTVAPFLTTGTTTANMQIILKQILNCPYQGLMAQMYLESKTLELFVLQLEQLTAKSRTNDICLPKADIDRIYHAKEILINNFENPPSLLDLARQVGLNDYKLKQGFRHCFGTTVFGYLRTYRMEQAKQLIAESHLTLAGVAQSIGYNSPSRFCDAFKRQFGMTPRAYQKQLHGYKTDPAGAK
ncbi:helix-turn-helix transcriptional regulator [Synechococcus moorigangaii CMS01]|nr:helix-turn-helix transcriptional regulator [Synechococcus moorigangaii CMS01]